MKILRTPVIALHLGAKQIDSQRHFRDLQTAWLRRIPLRGRVLYSHGLQFIQGAPASIILVNAKLCRIQWLCRYLCLLKSTSHTLTRSERPCPCLASPWWSASTVSGRACALSRKSAFFESCAKTKTFMYVSPSSHCPHSFFLQLAKTPASLSPQPMRLWHASQNCARARKAASCLERQPRGLEDSAEVGVGGELCRCARSLHRLGFLCEAGPFLQIKAT